LLLYLVTLGNFLHLKIPGQLFHRFSSSAWFFQGGRTVARASQARRYPGNPEKPMESSL